MSKVKYKDCSGYEWDDDGIEYDAGRIPFTRENYCSVIEKLLFNKSQFYTVHVKWPKGLEVFNSALDEKPAYTLMSTIKSRHLDWSGVLPNNIWVNPPFKACYYREIMRYKFTGCIVVPSSYADVRERYAGYKSSPYHVGDTRVEIFHIKPLLPLTESQKIHSEVNTS